jgi:hypothetical protein
MSDTASFSDSENSSIGDLSICREIDELITRFEDFHTHIHNSFETLQNIQSLVANNNNINIRYNNKTCDFDAFLEEFHSIALNNIKENKPSNFGESLIKLLEEATFN